MTTGEAIVEAHRRWRNGVSRGLVWLDMTGRNVVGYTDGEFRYAMGIGDSWEGAFLAADRRATWGRGDR